MRTLEELRKARLVACVRLDDAALAREAALAAVRGGVRALEVTLTTPGALRLIEELAREEGVLPGAGTVLERADVRRVAEAGGRFALSPVVDEEVVREAAERGVLAGPGAATPTEVLRAVRAGAPLVKLFPIGPLGGVAFLRQLRGPFPAVPFLPTGGVTLADARGYLDAGAVALGFGAEVFPREALARRDLPAIEGAARRLVLALGSGEA